MSYLILVAGLPGTGKTSLAKYLAKKMGIPAVSKDVLKEHLFDTIGFGNRREKVALGIAAADIMYHVADLHLEAGQPLILENNFENASKPGLARLVEKHKCKIITVKLRADMKVLAARFAARDKSPERHRGHVINTRYPEPEGVLDTAAEPAFDPDEYYRAMTERGMDGFSAGEEIAVDTTDFSMVSYEAVYAKIAAKLKELLF